PSTMFRAGVFGAVWHIPVALAVLEPAYFKEFFGDAGDGGAARMTCEGERVFLFGGWTAGLIYLLLRPQWSAGVRWWVSVVAMLSLLGHVVSMGYCRGLNINASHAYLPPMWLLSAVGVVLALVWLGASKPAGPGGSAGADAGGR